MKLFIRLRLRRAKKEKAEQTICEQEIDFKWKLASLNNAFLVLVVNSRFHGGIQSGNILFNQCVIVLAQLINATSWNYWLQLIRKRVILQIFSLFKTEKHLLWIEQKNKCDWLILIHFKFQVERRCLISSLFFKLSRWHGECWNFQLESMARL